MKIYLLRNLCSAFAVLFLGFAAGCWPMGSRYPKYDNSFLNAADSGMEGVEARWNADGEDFRQESGVLGPRCFSTMSFSPNPIPAKVFVTWKTADGKRHEQTVSVASCIQDIKHFTGSIGYKLSENAVTVVPIHQALEDRNERLGKATVP